MSEIGTNAKANGFIERTLLGIVSLLKETIADEEITSRKGFLQGSDPRLKCLSVAVVLVCALLTRSILELSVLYLICLALTIASSINMIFFLKRTLPFIPLFSLFIVLPAIFNIVTPGEPIAAFRVFGYPLSITRQGVDSAAIFFMRVLVSVSFAALLVLTTRHHVLLKVLRVFRVPQLFVMTMGMTYRYIYLLLDIVQNAFVAVKSRVGFVTSTKTGRRVIGAHMAELWLKSYRLQTQVYNAMLSRGYTGEPLVIENFRAKTKDFILLAGAITIFLGTLWLNRFTL